MPSIKKGYIKKDQVKWFGIIRLNKSTANVLFTISFIGFLIFSFLFGLFIFYISRAQFIYISDGVDFFQISELFISPIIFQYLPILIILFILIIFCIYSAFISLKILRG